MDSLRRFGFLIMCFICYPLLSAAEPEKGISALMDALKVSGTVLILQEEGVEYGASLTAEALSEAERASWRSEIMRIYDTGNMYDQLAVFFAENLEEEALIPSLAFFNSRLGKEVIALELAARRALMDTVVEDMARQDYEALRLGQDDDLDLIDQMIVDSDLIDRNVTGALNANLAFFRGLVDGGGSDQSEQEMLANVWAQEGEIRAETESWIGGFLTLSYAPLSRVDLQEYVDFYKTEEGRTLNRVTFEAFDELFVDLSYRMGQALARLSQSEPL